MRSTSMLLCAMFMSGFVAVVQAQPVKPPPPIVDDQSPGGHVSYVAGYKGLDKKWDPADQQVDVGAIDIDLRPRGAPVSIAFQGLISLSSDGPATLGEPGESARTTELNIGLRKVFENQSQLAPFIGGGLAVVNADAESKTAGGDTESDSAWAVGAWGGAGLYWHMTNDLHLGAAVQYTWAEGELFDDRHNFGGLHVLIMLGFHW